MTDALAQPYSERIAELERKLDAYRRVYRQQGRELDSTHQQYMDADDAFRKLFEERKRLRVEIGTLRSEASELMAENSDKAVLIADLRQRNDWHTQNAERQASVIREQGAEIERWKQAVTILGEHLEDSVKPRQPGPTIVRGQSTGQHDLPPTRAEEQEK